MKIYQRNHRELGTEIIYLGIVVSAPYHGKMMENWHGASH